MKTKLLYLILIYSISINLNLFAHNSKFYDLEKSVKMLIKQWPPRKNDSCAFENLHEKYTQTQSYKLLQNLVIESPDPKRLTESMRKLFKNTLISNEELNKLFENLDSMPQTTIMQFHYSLPYLSVEQLKSLIGNIDKCAIKK